MCKYCHNFVTLRNAVPTDRCIQRFLIGNQALLTIDYTIDLIKSNDSGENVRVFQLSGC